MKNKLTKKDREVLHELAHQPQTRREAIAQAKLYEKVCESQQEAHAVAMREALPPKVRERLDAELDQIHNPPKEVVGIIDEDKECGNPHCPYCNTEAPEMMDDKNSKMTETHTFDSVLIRFFRTCKKCGKVFEEAEGVGFIPTKLGLEKVV